MNSQRLKSDQSETSTARFRARVAFTLVEILIVISIIILLVTLMGAVIGNTVKKAREAATATLIEKIDKLLDERTKGFDRATKSLDFQRVIANRKQLLEASGIFGVSPKMLSAVARKDFFRTNFPQRFADLPDVLTNATTLTPNGVPDIIDLDPLLKPEDLNGDGKLDNGEDSNNNGILDGYVHARHNPETESSALLYYMLTRMQVFGVPPVGESEFSTSEVRDTDQIPNLQAGDGLLEFVDGWGRPLRFYRWPTRLIKPNGILGLDNQPGAAGVNDNPLLNNTTDEFLEFGKINTDDVTVPNAQRTIASYLVDGLATGPVIAGQWDTLSEDPDDPYGMVSTEIKRQLMIGINMTTVANGFNEMNYPTIDTFHAPLIISVGPDGDLGLFEPYQGTASGASGAGVLDTDLGILAQPIHGPAGPYDFGNLAVTPNGNHVISALVDNITNRNRRAGRGK